MIPRMSLSSRSAHVPGGWRPVRPPAAWHIASRLSAAVHIKLEHPLLLIFLGVAL